MLDGEIVEWDYARLADIIHFKVDATQRADHCYWHVHATSRNMCLQFLLPTFLIDENLFI